MKFTIEAPGKLNLCLYVGPVRVDGLHDIASLFESVSLRDTVTLEQLDAIEGAGEGAHDDRVICERVAGENLAQRALAACRERGLLNGPPVEVTIEKRIPVAAGMGGGSADAAATLRLVGELGDHDPEDFREIAFALGADVPSQLTPGASLVHGAGERVTVIDPHLIAKAERHYVIVAQSIGLSTADVFNRADRDGLPRADIADREKALVERISAGVDLSQLCAMVENTLEPAILALRPELARLPVALKQTGAMVAAFTGSGPTCFGIYSTKAAAEIAVAKLTAAGHHAHLAEPVGAEFGMPARDEAGS